MQFLSLPTLASGHHQRTKQQNGDFFVYATLSIKLLGSEPHIAEGAPSMGTLPALPKV